MFLLIIGAMMFLFGSIYKISQGETVEAMGGLVIALIMLGTRYYFKVEKKLKPLLSGLWIVRLKLVKKQLCLKERESISILRLIGTKHAFRFFFYQLKFHQGFM